jgi:uncharacterized membrane protein YhaH (DUF805 family)
MNYFLEVLKKYAVFSGRARRSEYWYFILFNTLIYIALAILGVVFIHNEVLSTLYNLAVLVPSIAVGVRRMHDVNKSGWFLIIPIYNLVLACTEGTTGTNEYGQDPKRPEFDEFLEEPVNENLN